MLANICYHYHRVVSMVRYKNICRFKECTEEVESLYGRSRFLFKVKNCTCTKLVLYSLCPFNVLALFVVPTLPLRDRFFNYQADDQWPTEAIMFVTVWCQIILRDEIGRQVKFTPSWRIILCFFFTLFNFENVPCPGHCFGFNICNSSNNNEKLDSKFHKF